MLANKIRLSFTEDDKPELILSLDCSKHYALQYTDTLRQILLKTVGKSAKSRVLCVEIKEYHEKRSLDANGYAWLLINKLADVLRSSKDEIYIEMLRKYGQREERIVTVVEQAVDMIFRATNNHCTVIGTRKDGYKDIAILIGSSKYDTLQMSVFIEGLASECMEVGIETMTPSELALLKERG